MHKTLPTNPSLPLYLLLSSSYLALQSLLLLSSPKLVVTLLAIDPRPPTTDLESYLCRALAWALLALAGFGLTCATALGRENEGGQNALAPASSSLSSSSTATPTSLLLPVTLLYHTTTTIQAYINYSSPSPAGNPAFILHVAISGLLTVYGMWVLLFGSEARVSSVDGRDKRVSGFLFGGGKGKVDKKGI